MVPIYPNDLGKSQFKYLSPCLKEWACVCQTQILTWEIKLSWQTQMHLMICWVLSGEGQKQSKLKAP